MDDLVSTLWLTQQLGSPDVVILDATLFMPGEPRDPAAEYAEAHIPGARRFDIEALSDPHHPAPHMLPGASAFGAAMSALGVGHDDRIVVYDNSPLRSATRAWFMLRHYGAERVAILDGGLAKWRAEGLPVEQGESAPRSARFEAVERSMIATKELLARGSPSPILDARGRRRFDGSEPDPRPGVAAGHIPGSRNLPFGDLYRHDGTLKSSEELAAAFALARVDPQSPFIATCGSGVTATSLLFAARRLGGRDARLYDGSWSEYGADPATQKASGPS
ncbi:MAG: 3-mercaptopyruvate sulfurtransferase [Pseudomonadota bacterium]|nr:3-mercaptopyruvate sulfurtransferase [Pseudomonadota bacterium]